MVDVSATEQASSSGVRTLGLARRARRLAREVLAPRAAAVDRAQAYPFDCVSAVAASGFMGMTLTAPYGGWAVGLPGTVAVVEQLAQACAVSARVVVEANLGVSVAAQWHAREAACRALAARIQSGDLPALCTLDAPTPGNGETVAAVAQRRGRHFVINATKAAVAGGGVSDAHVLTARILDANGSLRGNGALLAMRSESSGLTLLRTESTLGLRGLPRALMSFKDVVVPAERLLYLLEPNGNAPGGMPDPDADAAVQPVDLGASLQVFEELALLDAAYAHQLGLAAISVGIAAAAVRELVRLRAARRVLAELGIRLQAARSLLVTAAASETERRPLDPDPGLVARARLFTSRASLDICNLCMDAAGQPALTPALPLERCLRDARTLAVEGREAELLTRIAADELVDRRPYADARRRRYAARDELAEELRRDGDAADA